MRAIIRRELKNYLKRPLFWLGLALIVWGIAGDLKPYLDIHYVSTEEEPGKGLPESVHDGEVSEGYVPSDEEERRGYWEKAVEKSLAGETGMGKKEAKEVIEELRGMDVPAACAYLEEAYGYCGAIYLYEDAAYHKGTPEEINAYLDERLKEHRFSYYFSRKFADFAGLYLGFFASVLLAFLFFQDTRKSTYELLHTKPVSAGSYVAGKAAGGFFVCLAALFLLTAVFWALACIRTRGNGFEIRLLDFLTADVFYILPNMLMIVGVYGLIALLFKNPLPAVPFLFLYMVYSNMGSQGAEGYGYYGRPLAIMVRFPGPFFDTSPPPFVVLNQCFLLAASAAVLLASAMLWKRRRC